MHNVLAMNLFERLRYSLGKNTVRILMDVDGAISANGRMPDGSSRVFGSSGWAKWQLRHEVIDWLSTKADDDRVELIWSSTWEEYANSILEELDLDPIDFIKFSDTFQSVNAWYKIDGLSLFLEDCKDPVVIIDDEIPDSLMKLSNPRVLLVKTDSLRGISDEQLAKIDKFIEDYRQRKLNK